MVSRYSCSATVAWDSADMFLILVQRLHALCSQLHERAGGGREVRVTAGDEGERVGDRRVEADVGKAPPERAAERDAAGAPRVAPAPPRASERGPAALHPPLPRARPAGPPRAPRGPGGRPGVGAPTRGAEGDR